jgi:hypothetical protein
MGWVLSWRASVTGALFGLALASAAQPPGRPGPPPPRSARDAALVDLTGNWVAQITEDWRWRMITPPKGDYASVPLNARGREVADTWDLAADEAAGEQCRAFGAGGLLRQPTRVRISWSDDDTLKLETDAGEQTRLFRFGQSTAESDGSTWQGHSVARWAGLPPAFNPFGGLVAPNQGVAAARGGGSGASGGGGAAAPARGSLKVVTTQLRPGYLRKNGVPYSDRAVVTEYFDRLSMFGVDYLQVVTVVDDPVYLTTPFVVSNQFKREADGSKWHPTPCATDPPRATFEPPRFVQ